MERSAYTILHGFGLLSEAAVAVQPAVVQHDLTRLARPQKAAFGELSTPDSGGTHHVFSLQNRGFTGLKHSSRRVRGQSRTSVETRTNCTTNCTVSALRFISRGSKLGPSKRGSMPIETLPKASKTGQTVVKPSQTLEFLKRDSYSQLYPNTEGSTWLAELPSKRFWAPTLALIAAACSSRRLKHAFAHSLETKRLQEWL